VYLQPAPCIVEVLEYLKIKNIPVGIISNSAFTGKILEEELKKHGLRKYFKFLISSADYGLKKPHPFLFELAVSKIGIEPDNIWFIGDNIICDVEGSKNAGMIPFHYIGKSKKCEIPKEQTIENWTNLITILNLTY
jgi:putative hydrolase of the HAD superfamily